ncbi:Zinc finger and SCAN domain-containing protein 20, partial [Ophiophagus hannah]
MDGRDQEPVDGRTRQASPPGEKPFPFPVWEESSGDENGLVIHSQEQQEQRQDSPGDQTGCVTKEGEEDFVHRRLRVKHQEKPPQTRAAFARRGSGEPLGGRSGLAGSPRTRQAKEESSKAPKTRLRRGDHPFQCLTCGKTFSQKGNLAAHRRSHREQESLS